MGARGPAPKPTVIKQLQGNPGKRALNRGEPRPDVRERVPNAPRWLGEEARREWKRIAPLLHRAGLLTEVDVVALGMLCEALGMYRQAKEALHGDGVDEVDGETNTDEQGRRARPAALFVKSDKGNVYQHPAVGLMNSARADVLRWVREFGMTPAARARISVEGGEKEKSLADLLFEAVG